MRFVFFIFLRAAKQFNKIMLHHLWNYISYIGIEDRKEVIKSVEDKTKILFNRAMLVGSIALIIHYGVLFPFLYGRAIIYLLLSEISILFSYYFIKKKQFYTGARIVVYTVYLLGILSVLELGKSLLGHLAGIALGAASIVLFRKSRIDIIVTLSLTVFIVLLGEFEPLAPPDYSKHPFAIYARLFELLNLIGMISIFAWVLSDISEFFEEKLLKALMEKNALLRNISEINLRLQQMNRNLQMKTEEIEAQAEELQSANEDLRRLNKALEIQSQKTNTVNKILVTRNRQVMDSLLYAKRLQEAILPSAEEMKKVLKNYFVLYNPKDILSGDFYWVQKLSETEYMFAVGDATGHGVPGAIVSFICIHILSSIVLEQNIRMPDKILTQAKKEMCKMFSSDGMDIALCYRKDNVLFFSGAHNPLLLVREKQITEFQAVRQRIGNCEKHGTFLLHKIELKNNDKLYLFSDGILDQFGGKYNRKLGIKRFKEVLLKISRYNMEEQRQRLESFFEKWTGDNVRVDDVCVLGTEIRNLK